MKRWIAHWTLVILIIGAVTASAQNRAPSWDAWKPLMGEWVGEGTGAPGEGTGGFTFKLELQDRVLVRRNFANYPATKERPAFSHEDLMVVYPSADAHGTRAIYFDNEGHVINYAVAISESPRTWVFVSEPQPAAPRYRFTYEVKGEGKLLIRFEIAPPGKPEAFQAYIEATAHRKP